MDSPINDTPNDATVPTWQGHPCMQGCQQHAAGVRAEPCVGACANDAQRPSLDMEVATAPVNNGWGKAGSVTYDIPPPVPFVMRAGRYDPTLPEYADPAESPHERQLRISRLTRQWAAEDEALTQTTGALNADETPEQRKARLNREAQSRWRAKQRKSKEASAYAEHPVVKAAALELDKAKSDRLYNVQARNAWVEQQIAEMRTAAKAFETDWELFVHSKQRAYDDALAQAKSEAGEEG